MNERITIGVLESRKREKRHSQAFRETGRGKEREREDGEKRER